MARASQQKKRDGTGLADTQQPNTKLLSAGLFKVLSNNKIDLDNPFGYFLLNPASWEEHKASNWVMHNIPGESDPILQWTSGGARTVTVEALVTKDHSGYDLVSPTSTLGKYVDTAINVVGNIASAFVGVNIPALGDLLPIGDQGEGEQLSIAGYLNYYRSLLYPITQDDKTALAGSPPLVALFAGKTLSRNMAGTEVGLDTDLWVVTDLRINVTKQLPNLAPMEAKVTFTLVQYNRRTKDANDFTSGSPDQISPSGSLGDTLVNAVKGLF
jgi:hypothetical protein